MSQTQLLACDCTVTPPDFEAISLALEGIRDLEVGSEARVPRDALRWLKTHGYVQVVKDGWYQLNDKGRTTLYHDMWREHCECVESRK